MIKKITAFILLPLSLIACGGDDTDLNVVIYSSSSELNYTTVSKLGTNINDANAIDTGPEVSSNGLELYFHSDRTGGTGNFDLYVATRTTTSAPWGPATNLGTIINSIANERGVALSQDGLTMLFASDRDGGKGGLDIYKSTRFSLGDTWTTPENLGDNGHVVNTDIDESGPSLSVDGLSLYFHSNDPTGHGESDLYVTKRLLITDPWPTPANLGANINSIYFENAPDIASDGLTLYFHSTRSGGPGTIDIWRSTRASTTDDWSVPVALPEPVNSDKNDVGANVSDDWRTLYFGSDRGGNRDIWFAKP